MDERGGGLGDQVPSLKYAVRATQVIFLARGEGPYSLALGNPNVKTANLPLTTLIPDFKPEKLATLGKATVLGDVVATQTSTATTAAVAGTNWKKIGLWAVLLLSVVFLGAMAFSLLRKPPTNS